MTKMMSCGPHGQIEQVYDSSYCDDECRELESWNARAIHLSASQPTNSATFAFGASYVSTDVSVVLCSPPEDSL